MALDLYGNDIGFQPSYQNGTPQVYNHDGSIDALPTPDYGANPWSQMTQNQLGFYNQAQGAAAGIPGAQTSLQGRINEVNQYAQSTAYPTFQNQSGIGSQVPFAPATSPQPQAQSDPGATSRGFNPWSLQGEALSR